MTTFSAEEVPEMPMTRSSIFDPAREYIDMQRHGLRRVRTPSGLDVWVATRYRDVKQILGDAEHFSSALAPNGHVRTLSALAPGQFVRFDGEAHVRIRRRLAAEFTGARIVALRGTVRDCIDDCIDDLADRGGADLHLDLCAAIPLSVMCEIFGVPRADRPPLIGHGRTIADAATSDDEARAAVLATMRYLYDLVRSKRRQPGNDLISRLIRQQEGEGGIDDDHEVAGIAVTLLLAGHETTASQLAMSMLVLLLHHGDPMAALEEATVPRAVEELLRYLSVTQYGLLRRTTSEVMLGDELLPAGAYVVAHTAAANRDPTVFPDPDRLTLDRDGRSHLAFGHGLHQCVGKHLARVELQVGLATISRRIPSLRLGAGLEGLRFAVSAPVYRPAELPVAWDEVLPR